MILRANKSDVDIEKTVSEAQPQSRPDFGSPGMADRNLIGLRWR